MVKDPEIIPDKYQLNNKPELVKTNKYTCPALVVSWEVNLRNGWGRGGLGGGDISRNNKNTNQKKLGSFLW